MNTLHHKGYQGAVSFEDGHLVIQVLHIDDFITATCDSAAEAQAVFEELVDDYLETCAELGRDPNKPFKGSFNVRISPELHKRVAMAAAAAGETLNAWVAKAIEKHLEKSAALRPYDPMAILGVRPDRLTATKSVYVGRTVVVDTDALEAESVYGYAHHPRKRALGWKPVS